MPQMTSEKDSSNLVKLYHGLQSPEWDLQLAQQPTAQFFHSSAWIRVLMATYGYKPLRFTGSAHGGEAAPLFALMEVNSPLTGRRGVALPFTDECSPLCSDAANFSGLFASAKDYGRSRGWKYVEGRGGLSLLDGATPSTSFHGHSLDLSLGEKLLFNRTDASVRRAVRKAEQSGLTVSVSQTLADVRVFYSLLCKTRKRHGLPVQPFRFFANIHRHIIAPGNGQVVLAHLDSVPVAGAVFFLHRRKAIYKFGASDENYQQFRGNNLVMWKAIQWLAHHGFESLDFGRTSLANDGLRKFKLGWGTRERTLDYFRYDLDTSAFVTVCDESTGWHNRIFARLPVSLSRLAGAMLYKHVG